MNCKLVDTVGGLLKEFEAVITSIEFAFATDKEVAWARLRKINHALASLPALNTGERALLAAVLNTSRSGALELWIGFQVGTQFALHEFPIASAKP